MPNFEIRPLYEREFPLWDEFVDESLEGTLFHKSFWLRASPRMFLIYGYFKGGELRAGIPIPYLALLGFKAVSHPPLTPYLGTVFKKRNSKYVTIISEEKEINKEFARGLKREFCSVNFSFPVGVVDLQPFIWEGFSTSIAYTYIIPLGGNLEDIWKDVDDKRRNDIKKAEKDGIRIIQSDDFRRTYTLIENTFVRQEKKASFQSAAFSYDQTLKARKQCQSFLAMDKDGSPLAATYIAWDNKRSYYLMGGYDAEKHHHGASAMATWEAIKFSKNELGLSEFDFEGSMVPNIEQYFRKFGGNLIPHYTVSWHKAYVPSNSLCVKIGGRFLEWLGR